MTWINVSDKYDSMITVLVVTVIMYGLLELIEHVFKGRSIEERSCNRTLVGYITEEFHLDDNDAENIVGVLVAAIRTAPLDYLSPDRMVWSEPLPSNNHTIGAKTPFGTYYIHVDGGQHSAWLDNLETNDADMIGEVCGDLFTAQEFAYDDLCQKIKEMF